MSVTVPGVKTELRRRLREQRRHLPLDARRVAAEHVAIHLSFLPMFRASRRIACYIPADGEIETNVVIQRMTKLGKRCYLPVLSRINHDRLWFAPHDAHSRYTDNRYGILEPIVAPRLMVRAQELDLILLPLVGFDEHGHRLGMGGGFYDRSLEFLSRRRHWRKPRLIGLAFDFQKLDNLPNDEWDVPLDAVVTDRSVYVVPYY